MIRFFTLIFLTIFGIALYAQTPGISNSYQRQEAMPYLKDCKNATSDIDRYSCTMAELLKLLSQKFECPWRDLEGEYSRIVMRFLVNGDGGLERFLTLYSENSANRPSESVNNAMIRAVYATSGNWVPVREGGKTVPREMILPVECNCSTPEKPSFSLIDTIPAFFSEGHYQLESFIEQHIVYPEGFLSKSGRQTAVLLKAEVSKDGKLDSTSIRVLNLNQIDYRLSENAIHILMKLAGKSWNPALTSKMEPIDFTLYFKVIYVDDKNPKRGSIPTEWDITVGNSQFFNDGAVEFGDKNFVVAIELFKRAVFLDPDDKEAWLMLGESYIGARNNTEARVALQRAIDLGSSNAINWMKEAQKPDEVEPALPQHEIKKRPDKTMKVKPSVQSQPPNVKNP